VAWTLDDGRHRTVAARERGRKVRARIKGYKIVRPESFAIAGNARTNGCRGRPACDGTSARFCVRSGCRSTA
jgi:hypothetical protein